ncbi:MAG TPA: extracellular solute-binding protein, partial [Acidimicrobiales bacterium]|nr:extracellular solute-binding protein [Acidimicrobiales bacterium]
MASATTTTTAVPSTVNVVGYSVVGPAFKALEADFQATPTGRNVTFANAFGASDTETQDVINGQAADLVNLSYASNIVSLVSSGKVPANWTTQEKVIGQVNSASPQQTVYPTPGILTDSVVVFVVRKGNPLGIKTWADVVKSGVQIVTPNPATSGSAKWNLVAAYAAQISQGRTPRQAQRYLKALLSHTVAQPPSGSTALAAFVAGTGNVLLDYEDDALAAIAAGQPVQIVTPPQTILIENPVALTATGLENPGALAFYRYLFSVPAQEVLARLGFRSVLTPVWNATKSDFPAFKRPTDLLRIRQVNKIGWPGADPEFFSPTVAFPKGTTTYPDLGIVT